MLIHGGRSETGLHMRTDQHGHDLAAAIGDIGSDGFVKRNDEDAVTELGAVDDGIDICF